MASRGGERVGPSTPVLRLFLTRFSSLYTVHQRGCSRHVVVEGGPSQRERTTEPPFPLDSTPRTPSPGVGCRGHAYPSKSPLPRRRHDLSPSQRGWWWAKEGGRGVERGLKADGGDARRRRGARRQPEKEKK